MRDIFPIKIKGIRATLPLLIVLPHNDLRRNYGAILSIQTQQPYHSTSPHITPRAKTP